MAVGFLENTKTTKFKNNNISARLRKNNKKMSLQTILILQRILCEIRKITFVMLAYRLIDFN